MFKSSEHLRLHPTLRILHHTVEDETHLETERPGHLYLHTGISCFLSSSCPRLFRIDEELRGVFGRYGFLGPQK
jgi:hypothetical protein